MKHLESASKLMVCQDSKEGEPRIYSKSGHSAFCRKRFTAARTPVFDTELMG